MKIVAAIFADFVENFLGGRSALQSRIGSRLVIEHLLIRLARVEGLDKRCLFVRPRDAEAAETVVHQLQMNGLVDVVPIDDGSRPRRVLIRAARKWNLAGWRGSPLATTWFDEYVEPLAVGRVFDHYGCDHVLCLEGHQAVLDVGATAAMIAYRRGNQPEAQFVFTQSPPGLAGLILSREMARELLEKGLPFGITLAYRPEAPQPDLITKAHCYRVAPEMIHTALRLNADTIRGRELIATGFNELGEDCDGKSLCTFLNKAGETQAGRLPAEVELELTTADPLPDTTLRPRGARIPARCVSGLDAIEMLAAQLGAYDDRLLVLAGHGDPLQHALFSETCRRLRSAVSGLAVATPLTDLTDETLEAFFSAPVDLVEVQLDANSPDTYRKLKGADQFDRVLENLRRIQQLRQERQAPRPLIVCSLTRCAGNLHEIEEFYDRWTLQTGWAVIHGYNDFAGTLSADSLLRLTPPYREACRRLTRRMMLLADGSTPYCSQDLTGVTSFGNWMQTPLVQLWSGAELGRMRADQAGGEWNRRPLCRACGDWFRP